MTDQNIERTAQKIEKITQRTETDWEQRSIQNRKNRTDRKNRTGNWNAGRCTIRKWLAAILAMIQIFLLTACSVNLPMVSDSTETDGYSDAQTMLIIATERNRYRQVYTDQIWNVEISDDKTPFQTYLLDQIRSFLGEVKTMNLLADEQGLTLNSQEREQLKQLAEDYYDTLTDADKAYTKATRDDVYTMYEAYHRANRIVDELTKDVSLEISDSEARVIQVQEIAVSEESKAQELYDQLTNSGADFAATARKESENPDIEISVGRGEREASYEEPVFALESGQITEPFSYQGKWYLVKCVNDFDEEATLERKNKLALERKNQAFHSIYDSFASEHPVEIQGSIWNKVSLSDGADCTTSDFFERYQESMGQ